MKITKALKAEKMGFGKVDLAKVAALPLGSMQSHVRAAALQLGVGTQRLEEASERTV